MSLYYVAPVKAMAIMCCSPGFAATQIVADAGDDEVHVAGRQNQVTNLIGATLRLQNFGSSCGMEAIWPGLPVRNGAVAMAKRCAILSAMVPMQSSNFWSSSLKCCEVWFAVAIVLIRIEKKRGR